MLSHVEPLLGPCWGHVVHVGGTMLSPGTGHVDIC